MKQSINVLTISFIFISLIASNLFAQRGGMNKRGVGWGMGSQYNKMYNVNAVETITGEVISIDKITPVKGMSYGIHLLVKTGKETISVHLGPSWFMDRQKLKITLKDKVTIKGSLITFDGKPAIIAAEIKKGNSTLQLRNYNGYPLWSRSRME